MKSMTVVAPTILSPAARKIVAEKNIDPAQIQGTGKGGRVTKQDAIGFKRSSEIESQATEIPEIRTKMVYARNQTAETPQSSPNIIAMPTMFYEIDMTQVLLFQEKYREFFEKQYGVRLEIISFFVRACAKVLKEIPALNAEIDGDEVVYKNCCNLGIAIDTDQGVVVPVLRDADHFNFLDIEKIIMSLEEKAQEGKLNVGDLIGSSFTISNEGAKGALMSTPILSPSKSSILGLYKIEKRAVVVNDMIQIRPMMYVALTYDCRLVEAKEATQFLARIRGLIEDPACLLFSIKE